MSVRRIFVEKKPEFAVKAGELKEELEKKPFVYGEYICGLLKQIFIL